MSVATKNPFDLLGNDDGEGETSTGPVKTVDKTSTRTTKRNADEAPAKGQAPAAPRRGGFTPNDSFRDRNAGGDRGKLTDDGGRGAPRGGYSARVRGGRGARFPRTQDDRHSKSRPGGSEKQAAQGWGAAEGDAELKDEQAGEAIAQTEQKDAETEVVEGEKEQEPAEPEDKHISYADYLAQQAEKKLALESGLDVRKPNEGTKPDKKWANAKALVKDDEDEFISGSSGKNKRERERKTKQLVEIDNRYVEPERTRGGARGGPRGGRGAPRGDRPDRGDRGDRGDRPDRPDRGDRGDRPDRGEGRGAPRGGGGFRGEGRGARGGPGRGRGGRGDTPINTSDQQAFPELGK